MLLVMRPYQIAATEKILGKLERSNNYKTYGTVAGGGYIWHTTGSGKTLTSLKQRNLSPSSPYIDKVLFVVDRKDLDYQTMRNMTALKGARPTSNSLQPLFYSGSWKTKIKKGIPMNIKSSSPLSRSYPPS